MLVSPCLITLGRVSTVSGRGVEVSAPALKARPAPARITTAMSLSTSAACNASVSAWTKSELIAFSLLGRFKGQQPDRAAGFGQQYVVHGFVPLKVGSRTASLGDDVKLGGRIGCASAALRARR